MDSPLKDVAGMLRSFHYAAFTGAQAYAATHGPAGNDQAARPKAWANVLQAWVSVAFFRSYLETTRGSAILPESREDLQTVLDAYLFEKAVYGLVYELNNGPDWVRIPPSGIAQMLYQKGRLMEAFGTGQLETEQAAFGKLCLEFLRVPALSMGHYAVPAAGTDPQSPHTEDEVYYLVSGSATIAVGQEDRPVKAGTVVYVAANEPHRFHSIREHLKVLVFLLPPNTPPGHDAVRRKNWGLGITA